MITLRDQAWHEWIAGAYFRAYALHKDPLQLDRADDLLGELEILAAERIPNGVLEQRIKRLRGRVLIWRGRPEGREKITSVLRALDQIEPIGAEEEKEKARLSSDLCSDLSLTGLHDEAISLMEEVCARPNDNKELIALRRSNLATWLVQRAVYHRARDDRDRALGDLDYAGDEIREALAIRRSIRGDLDHDQDLELRECRAIDLSIRIERTWLRTSNLTNEIGELKALIRESLDLEREVDTPLQIGYRVGRLGVAHMRTRASGSAERRKNALLATAYLRFAWEHSRYVMLRPWLALDLCAALVRAGDDRGAGRIAEEAAARLTIQCEEGYPAVTALDRYRAMSEFTLASPAKTSSPPPKPKRR